MSRLLVVRWRDLEVEVTQLGIEVREELSIRQEDVDIVASTMVDLEHHGRSTAKRPAIDDHVLGIDLSDQRAGNTEQTRPIRAGHAHAASG